MKFIIDQNLPPVLCDWFEGRGQSAEHVRHLGMRNASDTEIVRHARETASIVVTRDRDIADMSGGENVATWVQVVWIRLGNVSNEKLFATMDSLWSDLVARIDQGDPLIVVGQVHGG